MIKRQELGLKMFDEVGFSEATLFMGYPYLYNGGVFVLPVWGVDFNAAGLFSNNNEEIFVNGISNIIFNNMSSMMYRHWPYKDDTGREFLQGIDNKKIVFEKRWKFADNGKNKNNFYISCVVDYPFGFCELEIQAEETVIFETNTDSFIGIEKYLEMPQMFTYK